MQLPLLSGFYKSRSVIASAQRCLNLYPEVNVNETYMLMPQMTASAQVTLYPTPGTRLLGSLAPALQGVGRCLYPASNGSLYACVGNCIYLITPLWQYMLLGVIQLGTNPVSMADNAVTLVIVDGTQSGYTIDLATNTFGTLEDPTGAFVGADTVQYLDGFFIFNKTGTPQFYTSLAQSITFDPLYFANKNGASDWLVTLIVNQRLIWLLGVNTTEIWYDSGAAAFPFQINPSNFIQHGCAAKYSVAKQDAGIFWLSRDPQGALIVVLGADYAVTPISTAAIQNEFATYPRVDDAIGFTYQQLGHTFYVLTFPTADKTWAFDVMTALWHERAVTDGTGKEHRIRANGFAFAYNEAVTIDFANGSLIALDPDVYTDQGAPIVRERSFPHMVNELKRIIYRKFIADLETGEPTTSTQFANVSNPQLGPGVGPYVFGPPSVAFTDPPTSGTYHVPLTFNGVVFPSGAAVEIAFGTSETVAPESGWVSAAVSGVTWTSSLTPEAGGTFYAWARQTDDMSITAVTPGVVVASAIAPSIVQSKSAINQAANFTLALTNPTTPGNVLLLFTYGDAGAPAGWTSIWGNISSGAYYLDVTATDQGSITVPAGTSISQGSASLYEVTNVSAFGANALGNSISGSVYSTNAAGSTNAAPSLYFGILSLGFGDPGQVLPNPNPLFITPTPAGAEVLNQVYGQSGFEGVCYSGAEIIIPSANGAQTISATVGTAGYASDTRGGGIVQLIGIEV